jgi:hypothetical protein
LIHKQKKVRARNMRRLVSREFRWPATRQKLTGRCTTGIEEWGEETLKAVKLIVAALAASAANAALAGPAVALGTSLGQGLGLRLGDPLGATLAFVLGSPLGGVLPIESAGLLTVSAVSLAVGIYIVKRKKHR